MTYIRCKIYAEVAKRFRKCIMNNISKTIAGKQYRAELKRKCKLQCLHYTISVNDIGYVFRDCSVCDECVTSIENAKQHSIKHLNNCKWYKNYWSKRNPKLKITFFTLDEF